MGGSVEGLLDPCPRAGRGSDNAAAVTYTSKACSNFVTTAVLDISLKAVAVKERGGCIDRGLPLVLKTCPLHTKSGRGKERRIFIGP